MYQIYLNRTSLFVEAWTLEAQVTSVLLRVVAHSAVVWQSLSLSQAVLMDRITASKSSKQQLLKKKKTNGRASERAGERLKR
jgi:hypothetical protein